MELSAHQLCYDNQHTLALSPSLWQIIPCIMASVFSLWAHDVSRRILKLGRAPFTLTCWPVISAQGPTLCSYCLSGRKNGVPHMKRGCNSVPGEPPLAPPGLWLWSDIRSEPIWVTKLFKRSFQKKRKKEAKPRSSILWTRQRTDHVTVMLEARRI